MNDGVHAWGLRWAGCVAINWRNARVCRGTHSCLRVQWEIYPMLVRLPGG